MNIAEEYDILSLLLEWGLPVDSLMKSGQTRLVYECEFWDGLRTATTAQQVEIIKMLLKYKAKPDPALYHLTLSCNIGFASLADDDFCKAVIALVSAGGNIKAVPPGMAQKSALQHLVEAVFKEQEDVTRPIYSLIFDSFEEKSPEGSHFLSRACLQGLSALASFLLSMGFSVDEGVWAKIPIKARFPALKLLIRLYTAAETDPIGEPKGHLHAHLMNIRRIARLPENRTQPESFHGLIECAVCTNETDSLLYFVHSTDEAPKYCGHYICKTCCPSLVKKECPVCRAKSLDTVEMAIYGTRRPLCANDECSQKTVLHYCKAFQLVYPSEFCTEHHPPKKADDEDPEQKKADDERAREHPILSNIVKSAKRDHVERYPGRKRCSRCHRRGSAKLLR